MHVKGGNTTLKTGKRKGRQFFKSNAQAGKGDKGRSKKQERRRVPKRLGDSP